MSAEVLRYAAFTADGRGGNPAGVVLDAGSLTDRQMLAVAVRNAFPPGGVVEDPATGAAAAAFGGYLRDLALVPLPAEVTLHQGHDRASPACWSGSPPGRPPSR